MVFGGIIAFTILILGVSIYLNLAVKDLQTQNEKRYQSYQVADTLRQSSDDLTRLARTYSVTSDPMYKQMYKKVLKIRKGEAPRPTDYHTIYWDLVLELSDKPKKDGDPIALNNLMKNLEFSEREFSLLKESQKNSDGLVNLEVKAMNAVEAGTLKTARDLLHSKEYHVEKAKIMRPIDTFFKELELRTQSDVDEIQDLVDILVSIVVICLISLAIISATGFFFVIKQVEKPVIAHAELLRETQENADLTLFANSNANNEIGKMTREFNLLIETFKTILTETVGVVGHVTKSSSRISDLSISILERSEKQTLETESVAQAIAEMNAAMNDINQSTNMAKSATDDALDCVNNGHKVTEDSLKQMNSLKEYITGSSETVYHLATEFMQIENVLQVIKNIAEQTNLLALNAAIEAARAGDYGRGFSVVADEVRALAQKTQESTGEIEGIINMLRNGVDKTVEYMDKGLIETDHSVNSVNKALDSFNGVVSAIDTVVGLSHQIASATEEQAVTIGMIQSNVESFKSDVNENANSLKELTSNIHSLDDLTQDLQGSISKFKVE